MDHICKTPESTFELGEELGRMLRGGEIILLYGGLGAGKTLLTKGIMNALDFDVDEVTSPSFALVNLYKAAAFDVYHIDLWRLDAARNPAAAVGLDEILEDEKAVVIIEWAERLGDRVFPNQKISVMIEGDGEQPRSISVTNENI
jgi:tRNA threonylcarbamoyladenosine biosynthesis protein TsaE